MGRFDWKLKNWVIEAILESDGIVFGGAARDKYLHDAHSTKFFEAHADMEVVEGVCREVAINELYQDQQYMPELSGRFVVPNDIDACVHVSDKEKLMRTLGRFFPKIIKVFQHDLKHYFPNTAIEENTVRHEKYQLHPVIIPDAIKRMLRREEDTTEVYSKLCALKTPVLLDLLVYLPDKNTMPDPPFGSLDFSCNGLILEKDVGYRLSKYVRFNSYMRTRMMQQILEDIEKRTCKMVTPIWSRVQKMRNKGWTVTELFKGVEEVTGDYAGHCIICHGDLDQPPDPITPENNEEEQTENDNNNVTTTIPNTWRSRYREPIPKLHMKLTCCDARYHPQCLLNTLVRGEEVRENCIMCSHEIADPDGDAMRIRGYMTRRLHA